MRVRSGHDGCLSQAASSRTGSAARCLCGPVLVGWIGLVLALGCTDQQIDRAVKSIFYRRPPGQELFRALQQDDADRRREAVCALARSPAVAQRWAVQAFGTIARTDPDPQVRCAAIQALGRSGDPLAVEPLLMILNSRQHDGAVAYPPTDEVRWDATAVLCQLCGWGLVPDQHRQQAKQTLMRLLSQDPNRHVRLEAARGLRYFQEDPKVLQSLIEALKDRDFGVCYEAEASLGSLTGRRFNYDAQAWQGWLERTDDPFSAAGQAPASAQSQRLSWWKRSVQAVRDVILAWQGQAKRQ